MNKLLILLLTLCTAAAAQNGAPRIAVYSSGDMGAGELRMLNTELLFALVKSGRYQAIERSDDFLSELNREVATQRSNQDDNQIAKFAERANAQFVCIVNVTSAFGAFQVSARIIDVKSNIVENMGRASGRLQSIDDATKIAVSVIASMFDGKSTSVVKPIPVVKDNNKSRNSVLDDSFHGGAGSIDGDTFTDSRDQKTYKIIDVGGGLFWFAQDMVFGNRTNYTWDEAQRACPPDWRLPNNDEWSRLNSRIKGDRILSDELFRSRNNSMWWSYTEHAGNAASHWSLSSGGLSSRKSFKNKEYAVRCVKY